MIDRSRILETVADENLDGYRLDKALAIGLSEVSRSEVRRLIEAGRVKIKGPSGSQTIKAPDYRVNSGDRFVIDLPSIQPVELKAEAMDLPIRYEDMSILVIDKPSDLVVHPGAGHEAGTLVHGLLHHWPEIASTGAADRPGIVHRLDKGTSGLLVVAKTQPAYEDLVSQFSEHRIDRRYHAFVKRSPTPPRGTLSGAIGRDPRHRKRMAVLAEGGRPAVTSYQVLEEYVLRDGRPLVSLVEATLKTGRTHQVRVHLADMGHPLLGDRVYGRSVKLPKETPREAKSAIQQLSRQALHAVHLAFDHPVTGKRVSFNSPLPADLAALSTCLEREMQVRRLHKGSGNP